MMCSKAQALDIKRIGTRDRKKATQYRRQLREHVAGCEACQKLRQKYSVSGEKGVNHGR